MMNINSSLGLKLLALVLLYACSAAVSAQSAKPNGKVAATTAVAIEVSESEQLLAVTIVNSGESTVDLYQPTSEPDTSVEFMGVSLPPGYEVVLEFAIGSKIVVYETDFDIDVDGDQSHFFEMTVGEDADAEPIFIPDARYTRPVVARFANSTDREVRVSRTPIGAETEFVELGILQAGAELVVDAFPGNSFVSEALDASFLLRHSVSFDSEQLIDIGVELQPEEQLVTVTTVNYSDSLIGVDEVLPDSIVRVGAVDAESQKDFLVSPSADLTFYAGNLQDFPIGTYSVTEEPKQSITLLGAGIDDGVVPLPPGIDLSNVVEPYRSSAAKFLANNKHFEENRSDIVLHVVYNNSDEAVWLAGLRDTEIINPKKVKPRSAGNVIGKVGNRFITWPEHIPVENVSVSNVYQSLEVSREMDRVIDISKPETVSFELANNMCKPLDIYSMDPFGNEQYLTSLEPMQPVPEKLVSSAFTTLVARAGAQSILAGSKMWAGRVPAETDTTLTMSADKSAVHDLLQFPRPIEGDSGPKSVTILNSSSRNLEMYFIENDGREIPLENGVIPPLTNVDFASEFVAGDVIVLKRPDVPPSFGEYGRFRVTQEVNQIIDTRTFVSEPGVSGNWIDIERYDLHNGNDVGTQFFNLVEGKDGRISGSSNKLSGIFEGAASFIGCADEREAFGTWIPAAGGFLCDDGFQHADNREASGGLFSAHRKRDNSLVLKRGACNNIPTDTSTWYHLPYHYDDMDPDDQAFETGMFVLKWAPTSFEALGRGFNLLRTDPMNFTKTVLKDKNDRSLRVRSAAKLFVFKFKSAGGDASQTVSKKIFGVDTDNEEGLSAEGSSRSKMVKSLSDYNDFAAENYSGSVGVPAVGAFSLSKSHEEVNNVSTGREKLFIQEQHSIKLHTLEARLRWASDGSDLLRQKLTPSMRRAVEQFPIDWQADDMLAFIENNGTHFSERIVYGGVFNATTEVSKDLYQSGTQQGNKLTIDSSGSLKGVQLGGGFESEDKAGHSNEEVNKLEIYTKSSLGGNGSKIYETWSASVPDKPVPINVKFRPIYDLFTPVFFPEDPDIGLKNAALKQATKAYFKSYGISDLTSDPALLDVRDKGSARTLCFQLNRLDFSFASDDIRATSGRFTTGFLNAENLDVDADHIVLHEWAELFPAGVKKIIPVDSEDSASNLSPWCFEDSTDEFVKSGSMYIYGDILINNGFSGSWRKTKFDREDLRFGFSDITTSPKLHRERIPIEGGTQVNFEVLMWEQ